MWTRETLRTLQDKHASIFGATKMNKIQTIPRQDATCSLLLAFGPLIATNGATKRRTRRGNTKKTHQAWKHVSKDCRAQWGERDGAKGLVLRAAARALCLPWRLHGEDNVEDLQEIVPFHVEEPVDKGTRRAVLQLRCDLRALTRSPHIGLEAVRPVVHSR